MISFHVLRIVGSIGAVLALAVLIGEALYRLRNRNR